MFEQGKIILVPFPFTDLSSEKLRPAVIISDSKYFKRDVIVAFISSKMKAMENGVAIKKTDKGFADTGLKVSSVVRCDKVATLSKKIVLGELGVMPEGWMTKIKGNLRKCLGL